MNAKLKKTWNIISTVLVAVVVILALLLAGARLLGMQVFTVLSGSMEPTYHTGSIIYVKKIATEDIQPGTVITFMLDEDTVATHRVTAVVPDEEDPTVVRFRTKGDANNTEDEPISADQIIGQYSGRIPKVGDFALFLQKPLGMVIFIGVPVCAFVVWDILRRRRETRAGDEEKEQLRRELERLKAEKPAE